MTGTAAGWLGSGGSFPQQTAGIEMNFDGVTFPGFGQCRYGAGTVMEQHWIGTHVSNPSQIGTTPAPVRGALAAVTFSMLAIDRWRRRPQRRF